VPPPYHELLVHEHHMTVAVEAFHKSPVNVRVLRKRASGRHYARMILLERQSDRRVVQFGIMRVNFDHLGDEVRREVESEATPLGRILIRHEVLRRIHLAALWRVTPGDELAGWFGPAGRRTTFGRTAVIECNGEPAVELLEIVTPED
jgi:chorismate-pyruvate lyase